MKLDVLKTMWTSQSVSSTCSELIEVESCKVFADGKAAVVVYKTHEVFEYNGTPNDDNVKYSAVFELADGKWKINLTRASILLGGQVTCLEQILNDVHDKLRFC